MHLMPRIWVDYAKFLSRQKHVTRTRRVYDRALQSLPATQHGVVWAHYLEWAQSFAEDYPQTAQAAFRRYIQLKPQHTLDYIDFLLKHDLLEEALQLYVKVLDDENLVAQKQKKTRFELWMELSEFLAKHPDRAQSLGKAPDELLRHAIRKYTEESGRLWVLLADYYTRLGLFGKSRDVFEEALAQLTSVRDFGVIFNAYLKFEEAMLDQDDEDSEDDEEAEGGSDSDSAENLTDQVDMLLDFTYRDIEREESEDESARRVKLTKDEKQGLRFYRLENLIQRRPFLLSNVVLRQNPNNVYEWLNRIKLCEEDTYLAIKTFTEAIQTIDPQKAFGKASKVWVKFAQFYEEYDEL